jgi:sugar phosphate isomerase/epimerase
MVGNDAYRNAFLLSGMRNVSKAALAALEHLNQLALTHRIGRIELAFPYPYGKVEQLDEKVGEKVDELIHKYRTTVHLPMAPLHTEDGIMEVIAGLEYAIEHLGKLQKQCIIHPAEVQRGRFWRKSTAFDFARAKEHGLTNLENILNDFKNKDITIGIENLAGPVPYGTRPKEFDFLFGKHGQLTAGWCLDTCHAYNTLSKFNDYDLVRENIVGLIKEYSEKDQLVEVHLTDTIVSDGPDKHCALGQGKVPLDAIIKALCGVECPIVVEVNTGDFKASWNWITADR